MIDVIFTLRSELDLFFHVPKYGTGTMTYDFYFQILFLYFTENMKLVNSLYFSSSSVKST